MGWWPFRRGASGRHALGAAVTSLPSGPLVLPVAVPLVPPPAAVPVALSSAPASERLAELLGHLGAPAAEEPDVHGVLPGTHGAAASPVAAPGEPVPGADGLAWLSEALAWEDPRDLVAEPQQVHVPEDADPVEAAGPAGQVVEPAADQVAAADPVERQQVAVRDQPVEGPAAGPALPDPRPVEVDVRDEQVLPVVVVPLQSPPPFVPAGPPLLDPALLGAGSVHLGFRDGSTASLDPEQARALQDLARSLTSSGGPAR